jgi:hypothetical protein
VAFRLFPHGPHGMGMALADRGDVGTWPQQALDWLVAGGILGHAG